MLCIHCYKVTLKGVNAQNILPFFAYCNLRLGREDVWQQINILLLFGLFVTKKNCIQRRTRRFGVARRWVLARKRVVFTV
jgi:hypothetical protein